MTQRLFHISSLSHGLSIGDHVTYKVGSESIPAIVHKIKNNGEIVTKDCSVYSFLNDNEEREWKISPPPQKDCTLITFSFHDNDGEGFWCAKGISTALGRSGLYNLFEGHYCHIHGC